MDRRRFLTTAGVATAVHSARAAAPGGETDSGIGPQIPARPVAMHVGAQLGPTTPEMLQFFKRHGVDHICGFPEFSAERGYWTAEDLKKTRDLCERHGVALDMVALPFLSSSHIDRERRGAIMLADGPERDRDIEQIQRMIVACAEVGVPAFKYNMSLLGVLRTGSVPGRGGSYYSAWRLKDARSARVGRSSTSTSATSAAAATTSSRSTPTRAIWTCCAWR